MESFKNRPLKLKAEFLVLILFILRPKDKVFRKISIGSNFKETDLVLVKELLNKKSIRNFSYQLIEPILKKESPFTNDSLILNTTPLQLENYLKKFKYYYRRYYFPKKQKSRKLPTDRELNILIVEALILICGI